MVKVPKLIQSPPFWRQESGPELNSSCRKPVRWPLNMGCGADGANSILHPCLCGRWLLVPLRFVGTDTLALHASIILQLWRLLLSGNKVSAGLCSFVEALGVRWFARFFF